MQKTTTVPSIKKRGFLFGFFLLWVCSFSFVSISSELNNVTLFVNRVNQYSFKTK
jgi:hypothetical protein